MKKTVIFFFLVVILLFSAGCSCGNMKIGKSKVEPTPVPTPEVTLAPTPAPAPNPTHAPVVTYSDWSGWSEKPMENSDSREVETREVKGYNLVLYVTQSEYYPYSRLFRDKSIDNRFDDNCCRPGYGEKKFTRFATADELNSAATYEHGTVVKTDFNGFAFGNGTGYLIPGDSKLWYIESETVKTEYRYRDISISYVG